jgi:hypothetical protein
MVKAVSICAGSPISWQAQTCDLLISPAGDVSSAIVQGAIEDRQVRNDKRETESVRQPGADSVLEGSSVNMMGQRDVLIHEADRAYEDPFPVKFAAQFLACEKLR